MDRQTLRLRLQTIESELIQLRNLIFALNLTDTEQYPQNYEELSTDAAVRSEKIACSFRNLIYATNVISKPTLMKEVSQVHGISISCEEEKIMISLPTLLPKRKTNTSKFLTDPLIYQMEQYTQEYSCKKFKECIICFTHLYDESRSIKRARDYDNMEYKQILDVIGTYFLTDDSSILCDVYHTARLGENDGTTITIMEKNQFQSWLREQEKPISIMSPFS